MPNLRGKSPAARASLKRSTLRPKISFAERRGVLSADRGRTQRGPAISRRAPARTDAGRAGWSALGMRANAARLGRTWNMGAGTRIGTRWRAPS